MTSGAPLSCGRLVVEVLPHGRLTEQALAAEALERLNRERAVVPQSVEQVSADLEHGAELLHRQRFAALVERQHFRSSHHSHRL